MRHAGTCDRAARVDRGDRAVRAAPSPAYRHTGGGVGHEPFPFRHRATLQPFAISVNVLFPTSDGPPRSVCHPLTIPPRAELANVELVMNASSGRQFRMINAASLSASPHPKLPVPES